MSGTIQIGSEVRSLDDATESWINDQLNRQRREGPVCVIVTIKTTGIDVRLATPACGGMGGGGGRAPNSRETEVLNLWNQRGLSSNDFTGGSLVAFLKQVRKAL